MDIFDLKLVEVDVNEMNGTLIRVFGFTGKYSIAGFSALFYFLNLRHYVIMSLAENIARRSNRPL